MFIDLGSKATVESTVAQNKQESTGGGGPVLWGYKLFARPEDAVEDPVVYLRFIAPLSAAAITGSVPPYLTVNNVKYPVEDVIAAKSGHLTFRTWSITAPTSVRPKGETHTDRIREELTALLKDEPGYYGGPAESFAVERLRTALRGFADRDYNVPSENYKKTLLPRIKKEFPGLTPKEYNKIVNRRRQFGDAYERKFFFLVQVVSAELDDEGKSVPIGEPKILAVSKGAIMKAFGIYRVGDEAIVPKSLVHNAQKAAGDSKFASAQGIPQDAAQKILEVPGGGAFHDIAVTISKGTSGNAKTSYSMDFRRDAGKAIATELSTPLDWGRAGGPKEGADDERELWGNIPDPVAYAQRDHEDKHEDEGPTRVQFAIDNWKRVLGFMTQEEFEAVHGGEDGEVDVDATTADSLNTADRLGDPETTEDAEEETEDFTEEVDTEGELMLGDPAENEEEENFGFSEEESAKYDELLEQGEAEGWLDDDKFAEVEDGRPLLEAMLAHIEPPKKKSAGRTRTRKPAAKK